MSLQEFVPTPRFEDYREAFKDFYRMERRDDGVLLVAAHTQGGPVQLSVQNHRSLGQMLKRVRHPDVRPPRREAGRARRRAHRLDRRLRPGGAQEQLRLADSQSVSFRIPSARSPTSDRPAAAAAPAVRPSTAPAVRPEPPG